MRSTILIFALLLAGSGVTSGTVQDSDRSKELAKASELSAQVNRLFNEQHYKEALPIAQQVVDVRQRLLSPDDEQLGFALSNLAEIYHSLKREVEATKAFQGALAVYEAHSEQHGSIIAKTLERLGYGFFLKGDYESAEPLYMRSVELQEKVFGPTDTQTILAMKNYACIGFMASALRSRRRDYSRREADDAKRALNARATCWVSGFRDDCASNVSTGTREGVLNGKAIHLATPPYPAAARNQHLQGSSFIVVLIDESGKVIQAKSVCGGPPELNDAAIGAARASRFTPTKINGQPVQVTGVIIYNFIAQ
jgi:TonB family protein